MISVRCLVTAAASVVGLVHGPDTSSLDLVYQLHELAERVQLPPERDYELAAMLYEQAVALDPLNAALRYNAGSTRAPPSACTQRSPADCTAALRAAPLTCKLLASGSCTEESGEPPRRD